MASAAYLVRDVLSQGGASIDWKRSMQGTIEVPENAPQTPLSTRTYIFPLVSNNGGTAFMPFSALELATLFSTLAAVVVIPLFTPFHRSVPENGAAPHPRHVCSPITRWWTYGWVSPFIMLSYRRHGNMNVDDLLPLSSGAQPSRWFEVFRKARLSTSSASRALWKIFSLRLSVMAFMMVLCGFAEFLGVVGLRSILQNLQGSPEKALFRPWFSALLFGVSPVVRGLCMQTFEYFSTQNICYLKGMVIYTIYRKLLRQRPGCHPDAGQVTTHVAADIDKIATIRYTIMAAFMVPVEVAVASVLLYQTIGWSYVPGLLVILVTRIPISWYVNRYQGLAQSRVMAAIDSRVRRVGEVIKGLQTIKMLGQSLAFSRWIGEKRKLELDALWGKFIVATASETISSAFVLVPLVMSLSIYTLGAGMPLTPAVVFTVMSIFNTLKAMLSLAVLGVSTYAQSTVSLQRIVGFLDDDPDFLLDDGPVERFYDSDPIQSDALFGAERATVALPSKGGNVKLVLKDISLKLVPGRLNLITGKTGSGKSVLLKALLSELPLISGKVQIRTESSEPISYAAQSPWLLRGTVRDNILFNSPFSTKRYNEVIRAVGLEADLDTISGDLTDVGEAGSSLSGGQKSRVALARAVYADTKTVLLDDVLSSLDTKTTSWIIENCFFGPIMKDRTLILVSEHPLCRNAADSIIEVHDGLVTTFTCEREVDSIDASKNQGIEISQQEMVLEETSVSDETARSSEPTISETSTVKPNSSGSEVTVTAPNGFFIILKYMKLFGTPIYLTTLCLVVLTAHASDIASSFWLTFWSSETGGATADFEDSRTAFYVIIYACLCIAQLIFVTISSLIFFRGGLQASKTLHVQLLGSVLTATFGWVTETPAGQIINRFSSDMFSLDNTVIELLKQVVENYLSIGFRLAAVTSMLPTFLLPAAAFLAMGLYTGRLYIYGSTASKKLYAACLSPLLTGLSDAISGIEVIRAHRAEYHLQNRFLEALERYLCGWETVSASQRWLAVRMDMFAGLISLSTATLALVSNTASPASAGFSMTSSTALYVVYLSSLLEVEMTSFQRVKDYIQSVPQEPNAKGELSEPLTLKAWPSEGRLHVHKLTAGYSLDNEPVLKDIDLQVHPGKRVAIVGRTGSGKSSLIASILRLIPKFHGTVEVDGVNVDTIDAERLRQAVSFIPQDPTLFDGSLRFNIDFSGAVSDHKLQRILGDVVSSDANMATDWSLDRHIEAGGRNLSQGERQLIALARALVSDARIIIIDEATASLDEDSEQRIQKLLRDKFSGKSLIAIAHRLSTVIDFDEVLVMEGGRVVERGNPQLLAESKQGVFWSLWQAMYSNR
ncbi:hypothetical protein SLS62_008116 [Diatrype stigma]|uniref:Uncharacterized protein n=1 Tax=Diatrype stigma TaxID=117547 RepID=A0AAN9UMS0_9PEZI